MEILKSICFGLISGFAEFLPVSVLAHQSLFDLLTGTDNGAALGLFARAGCLLALTVHYYKRLKHMQREMRIAGAKKHRRMRQPDIAAVADMRIVMTACVPMVLGMLFSGKLDMLDDKLWVMAIFLILNGVILYIPQFLPVGTYDSRNMSPLDGVLYGLAGTLSFLPGISRTGCVLLAGQLRGCDRSYMLDLTYLMSIPWLIGMIVLDVITVIGTGVSFSFIFLLCAVLSAAAAFGAAYGAIALMRFLAVRIGFHGFALYSWGVGFACFVLYLMI